MTLTERHVCNNNNVLQLYPRIGNRHPQFQGLECREVNPFFGKAGLGGWEATFHELALSGGPFGGIGGGLPNPVWSIQSVAGEQDIRTFTDFDQLKAQAQATDGYVEDEDEVFVAFTAPASLRGVQNFFAPSVVLTKRFVTTAPPPGASRVGKINQPDGPFVSGATGSGQNWLMISFESQRFGDVYETSISHLRSGDGGWNSAIYA
jgi:hypothetical protein